MTVLNYCDEKELYTLLRDQRQVSSQPLIPPLKPEHISRGQRESTLRSEILKQWKHPYRDQRDEPDEIAKKILFYDWPNATNKG